MDDMAEARTQAVSTAPTGGGRTVVTHYSSVAVLLHWLIAVLLLTNIVLAWAHDELSRAQSAVAIGIHMSTGILILLLSLVRLAWRLLHPAPPYPAGLPRWEKSLARLVHWGFYLIMIGMPLTGWIMTSGPRARGPLVLYGLVPWPRLAFVHGAHGAVAATWHSIGEAHGLLAWLAYGLIVLHVLAALKHQFVDRDVIMARMVPFLPSREVDATQ